MEPPEFPSNSRTNRAPKEEPKLQRITTTEPKRKKRSLRKQFSEAFVAGDVKDTINYTIFDILLVEARDVVVNVLQSGIDRFFNGEGRRRGPQAPPSGMGGPINYQHYAMGQGITNLTSSARALSRAARARHNFDEIILSSRPEAETVVDTLLEVLSRYGEVTVAGLYELVGVPVAHTDHRWGWTDLRGIGTTRVRDGYLLDLPDPRPL